MGALDSSCQVPSRSPAGRRAGTCTLTVTGLPCRAVMIRFQTSSSEPTRKMAPPSRRVWYIALLLFRPSMKSGYFRKPSASSARQNRPWLTPLIHIDTMYIRMPSVPTQKCTSATFVLYSFVPYRRGTSQYRMPKVMNEFQPSAPPWTWPMIQSV